MHWLLFRFVIACGLGMVLPGAVKAQEGKAPKPQKAPRIADIVVRGDMGIPAREIIAKCGLKRDDKATPQALETARLVVLNSNLVPEHLVGLLSEILRFRLEPISGSQVETRVVIELDVKKGHSDSGHELVGIVFVDSEPVAEKELLSVMQVRPGERLRLDILPQDVERIVRFYDHAGYLANVVDAGFGVKFRILTIPIKVSKIAGIELRGLSKTPEKFVRETMKLRVGSYYNVNDFKRDSDTLSSTGRFKDIRCAIRTMAPGDVNLVLTFTEKM